MNLEGFPLLTALIVLPLVGAVVLWVLPTSLRERARTLEGTDLGAAQFDGTESFFAHPVLTTAAPPLRRPDRVYQD